MAVKIGHASIDEKGKISGGRSGDQTGKEVCITNWYNGNWNVMLVCTDKVIAQRAADYMKAICGDDDFGYDQGQRTTGYLAIINAKGKVSKATPSEFDCSSLVASCYKLAGLNINVNCTTRNLRKALLATGKFVAYTDSAHLSTNKYAVTGAIYLKEGNHVVMVVDSDNKINMPTTKPTTSSVPIFTVGKVYTLQVELKVRTGAGTNFIAKLHSQLTADGRKHDKDKDGALDVGTKVTCKEVKVVGSDVWIKGPSGWMAAYYQGQYYIK
jgi:hypothetical protein